MVLKLLKIVHFLLICADLSKKPKYINAIYFFSPERPHYALSENIILIGVRDINSSRDTLDFLMISAKNCKNTIFDNLRTINQEGDMKTRLMPHVFHLHFEP